MDVNISFVFKQMVESHESQTITCYKQYMYSVLARKRSHDY